MRDYHESELLDDSRRRQAAIDHHDVDPGKGDESYLNTPNLGTPPDDAPEDAFRNTHRYSQKKRAKGPAMDLSEDTIGDGQYAADADTSRDLEDYKKLYLKQIVKLTSKRSKQMSEAKPTPRQPSPLEQVGSPTQRIIRKSARVRGSTPSNQSQHGPPFQGSAARHISAMADRRSDEEPASGSERLPEDVDDTFQQFQETPLED